MRLACFDDGQVSLESASGVELATWLLMVFEPELVNAAMGEMADPDGCTLVEALRSILVDERRFRIARHQRIPGSPDPPHVVGGSTLEFGEEVEVVPVSVVAARDEEIARLNEMMASHEACCRRSAALTEEVERRQAALDALVSDHDGVPAVWVCDRCGQPLGKDGRCGSGIHVGPGEEANGMAVATTDLVAERERAQAEVARLTARVEEERQSRVRARAAHIAAMENLRAQYRAAAGYGDVEKVAALKLAEGARQERKRLVEWLQGTETDDESDVIVAEACSDAMAAGPGIRASAVSSAVRTALAAVLSGEGGSGA